MISRTYHQQNPSTSLILFKTKQIHLNYKTKATEFVFPRLHQLGISTKSFSEINHLEVWSCSTLYDVPGVNLDPFTAYPDKNSISPSRPTPAFKSLLVLIEDNFYSLHDVTQRMQLKWRHCTVS